MCQVIAADGSRLMPPPVPRHTFPLAIWLGYLFFVVYGSLVPLDFRPLPLDQAWAVFQHIPMYKLGVESRADWISNGVLYVPVGFLTAHLLLQKGLDAQRAPVYFLAGLFSVALAFGVEFTQIFFPQRTVSLNDILAECVGSLIGLLLAAKYSDWFRSLLRAVLSDPARLTLRLLEGYLAGYVAFSLFPYDILLSAGELAEKLRGDNWGWLLAGDANGKVLTVLKLLSETLLALPFGLLLGYRSMRPATYRQAVLLGLLLGGLIEIAQFFTATGVSQGLSVLTRVAGICCGLALWNERASWSPERLALLTRRYVLSLGVIYLLVLLQTNGWFSHQWNGAAFAAARLADVHFLPFYYHYFTTEARALFSLASVCLMYIPVGVLVWANRGSPAQAFFYALFAAGLVETGKLFLQGMHADPTNLMLAAIAGWGMFHLAEMLALAAGKGVMREAPSSNAPSGRAAAGSGKRSRAAGSTERRWAAYAMLFPVLAFIAYRAATFPTQPVLLCLFLAACAAIIWNRPLLLVAILPAALPVFDLAPWSGRFYLDEFDLLLMLGLAVAYVRIPPTPRSYASRAKRPADMLFALACTLLALGILTGALRGLLPWQAPDANSFTNYYSPLNALRIAKGALWAFLLFGLLRRLVASGADIRRPLALGMVTGLALTVAVIVWERATFGNLFDFTSDYRVTGPFSSMHMGGAYIECFLAIATPFLLLLVVQTQSRASRLAGSLLLLASTYALMVTFSRNGYAAFAVALTIFVLFAVFRAGERQRRGILVAGLTGAMLVVAIPVLLGQFAQDRLATVGKDYAVRQAHWEDALNMRTPGLPTALFGMGLGRYPESHYLLSSESAHAGTYQLKREAEKTFLRLGAGDPIYVEQVVSIEPRQNYVLKLDLRSSRPDGNLSFSLCEKWMLTSFKCVRRTLAAGNADLGWSRVEVPLTTGSLGDNPWYFSKPVKFALHNPAGNAHVDVANLRLQNPRGENLLLNGDFSDELDHWFFSADSHLQWHAKSLPVAVLFDLGWFGLIGLAVFALLAIRRAAGRAWRGDLYAAAALASFCGFLVVGLFDTLIDAPRFLFLLLLLGRFCGFREIREARND
jgi:VanZ family protein